MSELEKELGNYIAELESQSAVRAPILEACTTSLHTAQAAKDASDAQKEEASDALCAVEEEHKACRVEVKAAEKDARTAAAVLQQMVADHDASQGQLEEFRQGPLAAFKFLSAREATQPTSLSGSEQVGDAQVKREVGP